MKVGHWFDMLAHHAAKGVGHPVTFAAALAIVICWGAGGPFFGFSDTWQLVINTGTTIVTFLMVFLIQHTQNRDSTAIHLKLDELLRVARDARNSVIALEDLDEEDLLKLQDEYRRIAEGDQPQARAPQSQGSSGSGAVRSVPVPSPNP